MHKSVLMLGDRWQKDKKFNNDSLGGKSNVTRTKRRNGIANERGKND